MTLDTPTNEAELAEIVRTAGEGGVALVTEGSGTKRAFGPAPSPRARHISLRGLAGVTHEAADMILSVDAGARLVDVQAQLARADQWLPLDPPFAGATIGGVLATNSSGPRRLGYGTSKDLLLGLRVVGAHGRVTKSGGRVVKNVSGYDLHRPQVGAFGTLGVIVRAHFKVCARPEVSALWALPCATVGEAHALLLQIDATALRPVALEALDAEDARLAALPATPAIAIVGIEGSRAAFERHARELASYAVRGAAAPALVEGAAAAALWAALAEVPARHADDVRVRIGARPHDLPALLGALELSRAPVRGVTVRVATGLAYVALAPTDDARAIAALVERWRRLASARDGYAVVESAPLDLPERALLPFGESTPSDLSAALRRAWDPRETLNAGRMGS